MSKWFKALLVGVFLCLSISIFARSASYQQVISGISSVYTYVLSKQATSGVFVFRKDEDKNFFSFSTIMVLYQLRQLGFPTNTLAFVKGVNFLDNNYHLSGTNNSYTLYILLNLQGKTKVNLSACAQVLKNELVKDYLLSTMFLPFKNSKTEDSSSSYYTKKLLLVPLILNIVKYTDEKNLVRVLNGVPDNVQVHQVDVDAMLPSSLARLYENLSKVVLKAYDGRNAAMTLYFQAQINDVLLNGYSEKFKEEEMKYIKRDVNDLLNNSTIKKAIEDVKASQKSDGSWNVNTLRIFQTSNINASQVESAKLIVTAINVYSLLKCGVLATDSTVEKGVEYIINKLNSSFLNENPEFLQGFIIPVKALESYLGAKWGKHYDVRRELPSGYLKICKSE